MAHDSHHPSWDEDTAQRRRGPFRAGERVQLTDAKGRHHTFTLQTGEQFHTHRGHLEHDEIIGASEGVVCSSSTGTRYLCLRPMHSDFVLSMRRGATIIYPKDTATIISLADVFPGARVVEAGAGSGSLTCALLRAVGEHGSVLSYERRPDFAEVAQENVLAFFHGQQPPQWQLVEGHFGDLAPNEQAALDPHAPTPEEMAAIPLRALHDVPQPEPGTVDAVILDMLAPWYALEAARRALRPGGVLVCYVATTTQLSRCVEQLRVDGCWTEPHAQESLLRQWHLEGLAVRPSHRMVGHTAFLLQTRRLADGTELPTRRTRPSKGSYGPDYQGPGSLE